MNAGMARQRCPCSPSQSGVLIPTQFNVRALPAGTFVCVLTSSGRYSEFVVTETVGVSPSPLKITFTTWEASAPSP